MMKNFEIRRAIVDSILNHARHYAKISKGNSLHDNGIEQSICYSVAKDIFDFNCREEYSKISIVLELQASEFSFYCTNRELRGAKPRMLSGKERIDISIFDQNDKIKGVIEMKRWMQYSSIESDISRIRILLERYGDYSLKWGCVAFPFYIWTKNEDKMKSGRAVIDGICAKIAENYPQLKFKSLYDEVELPDEHKWRDESSGYRLEGVGAGCIMLKKR